MVVSFYTADRKTATKKGKNIQQKNATENTDLWLTFILNRHLI